MQGLVFLTNLKKNKRYYYQQQHDFQYQSHFPYEEKCSWSGICAILSTMVLVTMSAAAALGIRKLQEGIHMILGLQDRMLKRRYQKLLRAQYASEKDYLSKEEVLTYNDNFGVANQKVRNRQF